MQDSPCVQWDSRGIFRMWLTQPTNKKTKKQKIKQIERKKSNKKINQNDTAKKQKQQNLSPRQIFFLTPDIQEKLQLIKWTMFASVDKSESAVFCDTLPLYIARARYWLPHDLHQIQFLFRSVAFTDKIQLLAIVPSTTCSHLIWNVTSLHPREIE